MAVAELLQCSRGDAKRGGPCKADPLACRSTAEGAACLPQNLEASQQVVSHESMFT